MPPSIFSNHSHRELFSGEFSSKWIVVTYCSCSAEKVTYASPPYAKFLWHAPMSGNYVGEHVVDFDAPVDVIPVGWVRQPGKEGEVEMIVCINQTWENQKATEIDFSAVRSRDGPVMQIAMDAAYVCACDLDGSLDTFLRPDGTTRSSDYNLPLQVAPGNIHFMISHMHAFFRAE